jgi:hypothetical protein
MPLNTYLLDDDCVYILKRCYVGVSKEDIINCEEIMMNFFGSVQVGQDALAKVTKEEWDNMD